MKRNLACAIVFLAALFNSSLAYSANTQGYVFDVMSVAGAWAKATPPGRETTALYMTILNNSDQEDVFVGATTPIAEKVEIHDSTKKNAILSSVTLKRSESLALKPGGIHLLLSGLKHQLLPREKFPITLVFTKSERVTTQVLVVTPDTTKLPTEDENGR